MALLPNDFSDEPENNTGEAARQPRTRLAKFLAKIAGVYGEQIEPKTEVERYLDKIAESGGGGGGGNVLTLYCESQGNMLFAYKDSNRTNSFSYSEAVAALDGADVIKVVIFDGTAYGNPIFATTFNYIYNDDEDYRAYASYIENANSALSLKNAFLAYERSM